MHTLRKCTTALFASALVLAACGGSNGGDAVDELLAESDQDDSGSGDEPSGEPGDDASNDGASDGVDDAGAGSNDEAQQDLDEAGVDIDLDELEDSVGGFSTGEGGGSVTIDGASYPFTAEVCIVQGSDFVAAGPGEDPDGTPVWVDISSSADFDFDDDGTPDETLDVTVEVGKSDLFGSGADDQPNFSANKLDSAAMNMGADLSYELGDGAIQGSGPIDDFNGVAAPFGESLPMTFEASCS